MPEQPVRAGIPVAVESEDVEKQPQVAFALVRAGPLEERMQRGRADFPFRGDRVVFFGLRFLAREVVLLHERLHVVQVGGRVAPARDVVVAVVRRLEAVALLLVVGVDEVAAAVDGRGRAVFRVIVILAEVRDGREFGAVAVLLPAVHGEKVAPVRLALAAFDAEEREETVFALVLVVRPPERTDVLHVAFGRRAAEERE